jgi:hypothetical protein
MRKERRKGLRLSLKALNQREKPKKGRMGKKKGEFPKIMKADERVA